MLERGRIRMMMMMMRKVMSAKIRKALDMVLSE